MGPAKHLLLVDDENSFRYSASLVLRVSGFRVTEAGNGREALLRVLESRKGGGRPFDLLITDIRMPAMSGLELIDELRRRGIQIPVLAISCLSEETLVDALAERGCAVSMEKPFEPRELVQRVTEILSGDINA